MRPLQTRCFGSCWGWTPVDDRAAPRWGLPTSGAFFDDQFDQRLAALFAGRRIEAIKRYRQVNNASLAEAKRFTEDLEKELRSRMPERFTAPPARGCGAVAVGILALACGLLALLVWPGR